MVKNIYKVRHDFLYPLISIINKIVKDVNRRMCFLIFFKKELKQN
jgi:hypothetical protein